jgi:cytosine/adenosine deaminase-related metal-dependent hydrolase
MIIGPCRVVTGGATPGVLENSAVRVAGAHIAQVGALGPLAAAHPDEPVWDGGGRVLMPGMVDAHAHLARHLARGLGCETAGDWNFYDRALAPEDVLWGSMAALTEALRHGITTVYDVHRSASSRDLSLAELTTAAQRLGVRLAACYAVDEADPAEERRAALEESLGLAAELRRRRTGRIQALVGVRTHSIESLDLLLGEVATNAGAELPVHVELGGASRPGQRWAGRPANTGPCLWAHAERAPLALVSEARERGETLAWARPGAWDQGCDPEYAWGSDDGLHAPPRPPDSDVRGAWRQAEIYYHRAYVTGPRCAARQFGEGFGTIEAGAPADLVLVDYQPATDFNEHTLPAHVVAGLARAPVSGAMVAGEVLMDRGLIRSVDEAEVAARARECARRVWKRLAAR